MKNWNQPIQWGPEQEKERQEILRILTSSPVLAHPDLGPNANNFIVTTDASRFGIGGTLTQRQTITHEGQQVEREVVIGYCSRRLTLGESGYGSFKLELLAIKDAILKWQFFLKGRQFDVRTDNQGLEWLRRTSNSKTPPTALKWQNALAPFDFQIIYVPSTRMKVCDALSRKTYKEGDYGTLWDVERREGQPVSFDENENQPSMVITPSDFPYSKVKNLQATDDDGWIEVFKRAKPKSERENLQENSTIKGDPKDHTGCTGLIMQHFINMIGVTTRRQTRQEATNGKEKDRDTQ